MADTVQDKIVGATVTAVRPASKSERALLGFEERFEVPVIVVLSTGIKLVASRDHEGNGAGAQFFIDGKETGSIFFQAKT